MKYQEILIKPSVTISKVRGKSLKSQSTARSTHCYHTHSITGLVMCAQVAYCSDMDKSVIIANMEKRGWVAVGPEDEWQFYWASTQTCR